ncbi:NDxxF motif lipoprotein [Staphylococcus sp. SQ8-PEA]|uniref:NDxxF motif lipoprotein n=1 Tax=Staphylococcus marylandisciuri TaxID=2981529 RepID=A0ABT2QSI8_9STAP|nr:NDxxF motif lipoprotein [Staphylococcus marylandisciuri]MCU5746966.1 NDxxF motif lipoprotein [Staphylococcus marylandisciuri]
MRTSLMLGILVLSLFIAGCSNSDSNDIKQSDNDYKKVEKKDLPSKVFDNQTTNSYLSEQEIKEAIKIYLNTDNDLNEAKEYYQDKVDSEEDLSKKESKEIKKLNKLTKDNDNNFRHYISNNTLPEGYKKYSFKISKYISTSNKDFQNLDEQINSSIDEITESGKVSTEHFNEISEDSKVVNGKEQDKIEKFLKEKNIKTRAFKN